MAILDSNTRQQNTSRHFHQQRDGWGKSPDYVKVLLTDPSRTDFTAMATNTISDDEQRRTIYAIDCPCKRLTCPSQFNSSVDNVAGLYATNVSCRDYKLMEIFKWVTKGRGTNELKTYKQTSETHL